MWFESFDDEFIACSLTRRPHCFDVHSSKTKKRRPFFERALNNTETNHQRTNVRMTTELEELRQRFKKDLIDNNRYLVVFLDDKGGMLPTTKSWIRRRRSKRSLATQRDGWCTGDTASRGSHISAASWFSLLTLHHLSFPSRFNVRPLVDLTVANAEANRIILDTGASRTIVKTTQARIEVLAAMGSEKIVARVANGGVLTCYETGATIEIDGVVESSNVLCSSEVTNTVFGLDHLSMCIVSMAGGRVGIAWCGDSA